MRIFSGIQPTGQKHLGNYLGAIVQYVEGQQRAADHGDVAIYCVVDLHSMTVPFEAAEMRTRVYDTAAILLAAGLDPERCIFIRQSDMPEHTELAWHLGAVCSHGDLNRMTQFKEKSAGQRELVSADLFFYPVLMAADVLAYRASEVPVGDDQRQHLELTRDVAAKFNHDFEVPGFFPLPEALTQGPGARIMSLRDGAAKMSKSDPSDNSRLNLLDDADAIAQKIRKAKTDMEPLPDTVEGLEGRAEAKNLVAIYAALAGLTREQVIEQFGGQGFGAFKPALADLAVSSLAPVTAEMRRLMADPAEIDRVLKDGAERAAAVADPVVDEVKKIVGFWRA